MKQNKEVEKTGNRKKVENWQGIYFLATVVLLYFFLAFFQPGQIQHSIYMSMHMFMQILPVLLLIICLMGIMNCLVKPKMVSKYVGRESGIKGYFLAIAVGILSHGPIYAWYPLLRDLRNQGMKCGLIAVLLYTRAIKIPLLPVLVYYFGLPFVVILTLSMIIAAIIQGQIVQIVVKD